MAAIGLIVATLAFVHGSVWQILLLIALGVAYTVVAAGVARTFWAHQRSNAPIPSNQFRHPVLIVNPKSGDGRAIKAGIPELAGQRGIKVIITKAGDNIAGLAQTAVDQGADVIGVSGGDGTLGAVAAVAIKHKLPLVILPGGTRCHFARDIGLDPEQISESLAAFDGVERFVDAGLINERVFLNNASFGLYADIISRPEYRDHKLDVTSSVTQELASSTQPYYRLHFHDNHNQPHTRAAQVLVGVNRYETLSLGELGQRKQLDKGELQVINLPELSNQTMRQLATRTTGLQQWTAPSFTITDPSGWVIAGVDGESVKFKSPVEVSILPRALRLQVPREGIRSRPIKAFSLKAADALWRVLAGKV
jgi:diacylglycerol kinase family enzyme